MYLKLVFFRNRLTMPVKNESKMKNEPLTIVKKPMMIEFVIRVL